MIRLFRISVPVSLIALMITEFLMACGCYVSAFLLVSEEDLEINYLYEGGLEKTLLVVLSILLGVYFNDLYSELHVLSRLRLAQQYCLVMGVAFLSQALLSYVDRDLILPRAQMMLGSMLALFLLPVWRILFDLLVLRVLNRQRVLFLGMNQESKAIAETIAAKPQLAMTTIGYLDLAEDPDAGVAGGPWLGSPDQLAVVYEQAKPDLVVVGLEERRGQLPVQELLSLRLRGAMVEDVASLYERVMWRISVASLRPSQIIFSGELGPRSRSLIWQRAQSYLIASIGVVLAAPALLLVWLTVRLSSKGPAVYRQRRVGLNGRVFEVLKFRSMYIDAEARTGAVWAQKNDPRITPVGRWLRKLRLDELPQFFNVLKGDMAIVGPRPERPEFVKVLSEQIPFYAQRHTVLPGITGWAQINHKYGDTLEDTITKLEFDLYYMKNLSLSLDLYIIFNTVKVMLLSRGSQ